MQRKDALKLRKAWGDKPCIHPRLDREYDLGAHTGDVVCTVCGRDFPNREAAKLDANKNKGNEDD